MEASAVPRMAPTGVTGVSSPQLLRLASDARLVALIRQGWPAAFEAVYDRHHRGILSFCRHMLGDADEAEDAVQHTFLSAYNDLIASEKQIHLRAWLFTIARNRCYSILRSRREQPSADLDERVTEGLATQVQRRQDLRDLVVDLRRLPEEQRAALVLAEIDALSHEQIGEALGVPREKVKSLVFQARESLVASRAARETACADIREQLVNGRGGALRRSNLRRHLRECAGCRDFRKLVERQRRQLAVVIPVIPTLALKEGVLTGSAGAGAGAGFAGGSLLASSALKSGFVKGIVALALAGVGTAGTFVATQSLNIPPFNLGNVAPRQPGLTGGRLGAPTSRVAAARPDRHVLTLREGSRRTATGVLAARGGAATATGLRHHSGSAAAGGVLNPFGPLVRPHVTFPHPPAAMVAPPSVTAANPPTSSGPTDTATVTPTPVTVTPAPIEGLSGGGRDRNVITRGGTVAGPHVVATGSGDHPVERGHGDAHGGAAATTPHTPSTAGRPTHSPGDGVTGSTGSSGAGGRTGAGGSGSGGTHGVGGGVRGGGGSGTTGWTAGSGGTPADGTPNTGNPTTGTTGTVTTPAPTTGTTPPQDGGSPSGGGIRGAGGGNPSSAGIGPTGGDSAGSGGDGGGVSSPPS
jgi:RNA polymerase sigma factor (sigma-70 family)